MGLFRTVSEINGDFSGKFQNFRTPMYFAPTLKGGIGIGYRRSGSKKLDGATWPRKKFDDIFSSLDTSTNVTDRRTDDSKDRAYA